MSRILISLSSSQKILWRPVTRSALSRPGMINLPSNQSPVKMDAAPVPSISATPPVSVPSANGSVMGRQPVAVETGAMIPTPGIGQQMQPGMQPFGVNGNSTVTNMPLNQQTARAMQSAQSKYVKVWEGYRQASASETLAANWPVTMQIVRLISQDHLNNKQYVGKTDFLVFRAMNQHGFLGQLQEKKLCAVIQLPSQTLLLSVSDKAYRLFGMLFPGDMVVFKPQPPNSSNSHILLCSSNSHILLCCCSSFYELI